MQTIRWIENTLNRRKWLVAGLSLLQCVLAVSGIAFALLMRRTIDNAVAGNERLFWMFGAALGCLILLQILLRALSRYLEETARASIENCIRMSVFRGIMGRDYRSMSAYHTGELMNRITSDASVVMDGVVSLIPSLLSMVLRILGVLVVLYAIEPLLALVFFVGGIVMACCSLLPRKWLKRLHRRVQETDGAVRCFLQECMESLLIIHTFGSEEKMSRLAGRKMEEHRRIRRHRNNVSNIFSTGMNLAMQCGYLLGFIWCGLGILHGTITYGTLTAVIQLIGQIQIPFASLGGILPKFAAMMASAERLMELRAGEQIRTDSKEQSREEIYHSMEDICFDHVSFCYSSDIEVLKDETFSVKKGEFVAITGSSGIGKSTLMKLLLAAYEPDSGEIAVCTNEKRIPVSELPSGIFAYVPQGNHLMSGTIREVVGFAEHSDDIDDDKVKYACRAACAEEFIEELPMKYDTLLGEKGAGLSEGQMQRLAVARAVYSECPVLLLDEATSALDGDTEKRLIASLRQLPDRTVFLITHRREAWSMCDRILERKGTR